MVKLLRVLLMLWEEFVQPQLGHEQRAQLPGVVVQAAAVFFQHDLQLGVVKPTTVRQRQHITRPLKQWAFDPFTNRQSRHGFGAEHKIVVEVTCGGFF